MPREEGPGCGAPRTIVFEPAGPVIAAFMDARPRSSGDGAGCKVCIGPIGSQKTTAACVNVMELAAEMPVNARTGWRSFKVCVVKNTLRQLWDSTIPTWLKRYPESWGVWTGGADQPARHWMRFKPQRIELIADFVGIGQDGNVEAALRGYEPTAFILDEVDLLPRETIDYCLGRAGRYPELEPDGSGGPGWRGVIGVCNAFDRDHHLYDLLFVDPPQGVVAFVQPSGFSPQAENLKHLPSGYYQGQAEILARRNPRLVRRLIGNEFLPSADGEPVHPEFDAERHVAAVPARFDLAAPLEIGLDAGLHPAAVAGQRMEGGRWMLFPALYLPGLAAPAFAEALNRWLAEHCPGANRALIRAWCDPSAEHAKESSPYSWRAIIQAQTGIAVRPAPGNNEVPARIAVVRHALTTPAADGRAGLQLDPRDKLLRVALAGRYRYRRQRTAAGEVWDDRRPEKNEWSNPVDALQYLLLGAGEFYDVVGRRRAASSRLAVVAGTAFDPLAA